MINQAIYSPILKSKQNEMLALMRLNKKHRDVLLPCIDLVAPSKKADVANSKSYVEGNIAKLGPRLREYSTVLLDSSEIDSNLRLRNDIHPLYAAAESLSDVNVTAVPVVGLARDGAHVEAAKAIISDNDSGSICVRLDSYDMQTPSQTAAAFKTLLDGHFSGLHVVLMYDFENVFNSKVDKLVSTLGLLDAKLDELAAITKIVCASGIPTNIAEAVPTNSAAYIQRVERNIYKRALDKIPTFGNRTKVIFGDYATVNPNYVELDWALINRTMTPKITYALEDRWFVIRGGSFRNHPDGYAQYYSMAAAIRKLPQASPAGFSYADDYISDRAKKIGKTGGPGSWTGVCVNRHLSITANTLIEEID